MSWFRIRDRAGGKILHESDDAPGEHLTREPKEGYDRWGEALGPKEDSITETLSKNGWDDFLDRVHEGQNSQEQMNKVLDDMAAREKRKK